MDEPSILPAGRDTPHEARLCCFSHAGGGAAAFYRWAAKTPDWLDIFPWEASRRHGQACPAGDLTMAALVSNAADALSGRLDRPYALLGNSMGAIVAFEVAREMRRRGLRLPCLLVAAASHPPHHPVPKPWLHELPDDQLIAAVQDRYDGIPQEIARQPELLRIMLPALRADIRLVETHTYRDEPPLDVDILALGGAGDSSVGAAQINAWRQHTTRSFAARQLPGGHFFLFDAPDAEKLPVALAMIIERLRRAAGLPQSGGASSP